VTAFRALNAVSLGRDSRNAPPTPRGASRPGGPVTQDELNVLRMFVAFDEGRREREQIGRKVEMGADRLRGQAMGFGRSGGQEGAHRTHLQGSRGGREPWLLGRKAARPRDPDGAGRRLLHMAHSVTERRDTAHTLSRPATDFWHGIGAQWRGIWS
jgi:hypothetical protein